MNKHTAVLPDGTVATRNSKNRVYPYCVAVREGYDHALALAKMLIESDRSNYAYYKAKLDGTSKWLAKSQWETDEVYAERIAKELAEAEAEVGDCETAANYQRKLIERRVARVEANRAKGYYDKWGVLGWTSRLDLAQASAASARAKGYLAEAVIIETNMKE